MDLLGLSPIVQMARATDDDMQVDVVAGYGADDAGPGVGMVYLLGIGVLVIGTSYVAGRAMAPRPDQKGSYGIGGAVLGTLLGPLGLGILGAVSLSSKR